MNGAHSLHLNVHHWMNYPTLRFEVLPTLCNHWHEVNLPHTHTPEDYRSSEQRFKHYWLVFHSFHKRSVFSSSFCICYFRQKQLTQNDREKTDNPKCAKSKVESSLGILKTMPNKVWLTESIFLAGSRIRKSHPMNQTRTEREKKEEKNELKWNYVNKIQFVNETNTRMEY